MRSLQGKTVLITGASSGIGAALAREFSRQGAKLVLGARRLDRLDELARELEAQGGQAMAAICDVCRDGDVERVIVLAKERFGAVDVVIANAGFGVVGKVETLKLDDFRRQFETNVFGVLRTAQAAIPELKRTRGALAIVGSVAGHIALPEASPYAMSKFAVRALANSLRGELRASGVSVTLISPGFVATEIRKVDNAGELRATVKDPIPEWLRMPAQTAARQIVRAIRGGRREAVITFHGKIFVFLKNHFSPIIGIISDLLRNRPEPGKPRDTAR